MWKFDFENSSTKGADLHGVVAEKIGETPFTGVEAMIVTEFELVCVTSNLQVWCFDF